MKRLFSKGFCESWSKLCSAWLVAVLAFFSCAHQVSAAEPNDPFYKDQRYLSSTGFPQAWEFAKGSPTVRVAVLDTGVDLSHPDLQDRIWTNRGEISGDGIDNDGNGYVDDVHGWDFVGNDADPNPDLEIPGSSEGANHGTLVAGVIGAAGNNGQGVAGTNWNVELIPLRVLDSAGSGGSAAVEAAVRYAIAQKARVINLSFSGFSYSEELVKTLRTAFQAGIVIVAAAGNEGDTERGGNLNVYPEYPVCYKGAANELILIGVSSLDARDRHSSFSSYGSDCISVSAPGENIATTQAYRPGLLGFEKPYGNGWSGSSLAAPLVSGLAALLISMDPTLTPIEVRAAITAHAQNIDAINGTYAGQLGAGRLDAAASVLAVQAELLRAPDAASSAPGFPASPPAPGELIRASGSSTVYYKASDGKRYGFPNAKTYATWFQGFANVKTIPSVQLASLPLGGTVTYRPGMRLLKIRTRPEVYAVAKGGVLRHIASEAVARDLYGDRWQSLVDDLPEAFFAGYRLGSLITQTSQYDVIAEKSSAPNIEADRNLPIPPLSKP